MWREIDKLWCFGHTTILLCLIYDEYARALIYEGVEHNRDEYREHIQRRIRLETPANMLSVVLNYVLGRVDLHFANPSTLGLSRYCTNIEQKRKLFGDETIVLMIWYSSRGYDTIAGCRRDCVDATIKRVLNGICADGLPQCSENAIRENTRNTLHSAHNSKKK